MPELKLFHAANSRSFRALWGLEETGAPYALERIEFQAPRPAALLAANPMGKVPTLVADGVPIADSTAILLFLGDAFPGSGLAPQVGEPGRGTYLELMTYTLAVLEPILFVKLNDWDYNPNAAGWGKWETAEARLKSMLGAGPYVMGERFSAADILIGSAVAFMIDFKAVSPEPTFTDYLERLKARPAHARAMEKDAG